MDDSDRATEQEALHLNAALSVRKLTLPIVGFCYNCNERVSGLFCDADCRVDYEDRKAAERRSGHAF